MRNEHLQIRVTGLTRLPASARRAPLITRACRAALGRKPRTRGLKCHGELNIVFLDKGRMRPLNRRFLGHDRDTDVLAFNYDAPPSSATALSGERRKTRGLSHTEGTGAGDACACEDDASLRDDPAFGDVFVSADKARTQARDLGHSVLREVLILVTHGTLHLLGYDDKSAAGRREMARLQEKIVGTLRLPKGA